MTASGKFNFSFTSVYDNKMTDFVELLTIALLFVLSGWTKP